jgi:hypothetical protein
MVSDPINIEDNIILNKRDLIIKKTNRSKMFNFNNYDKRFFVEDKKSTKALYTEDGVNYLVK